MSARSIGLATEQGDDAIMPNDKYKHQFAHLHDISSIISSGKNVFTYLVATFYELL